MSTDAPQPGTPLPWEVGGPYIREAAPTKVVVAHVLPYHRGDEKQNQAYIVYAANELPKREARIERLETALMLVTDGPASRRALSMKEARVVADDALRAGS